MIYSEEDIDLLKLNDAQFEEVCFELLTRLGFKELVWRRGGADDGRDIEGQFAVTSPLFGTYDERWFFECKRYEEGVPAEELNSKIAWADAEKPKHLAFFVSSHLTNSARNWLEKISRDKFYSIHLIEGKQLRQLLLGFSDIIARYFIDAATSLLFESRKTWLLHDILPSEEAVHSLLKDLDPKKLSTNELGFLWCITIMKASKLVELIRRNISFGIIEPISLDPFFQRLTQLGNAEEIGLADFKVYSDMTISRHADPEEGDVKTNEIASRSADDEWSILYHSMMTAHLLTNASSKPRAALFTYFENFGHEGIEVLVEATSEFPTKVRYISCVKKDQEDEDMHLLRNMVLRQSSLDSNAK
jgi:Restriction endonuclease